MSQEKPKDIQEAISRMAALISHVGIEFNNMIDFLAEQGVDLRAPTPPPLLDTAFLNEQVGEAVQETHVNSEELQSLIDATKIRMEAGAKESLEQMEKTLNEHYGDSIADLVRIEEHRGNITGRMLGESMADFDKRMDLYNGTTAHHSQLLGAPALNTQLAETEKGLNMDKKWVGQTPEGETVVYETSDAVKFVAQEYKDDPIAMALLSGFRFVTDERIITDFIKAVSFGKKTTKEQRDEIKRRLDPSMLVNAAPMNYEPGIKDSQRPRSMKDSSWVKCAFDDDTMKRMGTFYRETINDSSPKVNLSFADSALSEAEVATPEYGSHTMAFIKGEQVSEKVREQYNQAVTELKPDASYHTLMAPGETMHGLQGYDTGESWTVDNLVKAGDEGKEVIGSTTTIEPPKTSPVMQTHVFTSVQHVDIPDPASLHGDARRLFEKAQELMKVKTPAEQEKIAKLASLVDADNPVSQIAATLMLPTIGTTIGDQPGYENEAGVQFKPKDLLSQFKKFDIECFGSVGGVFKTFFNSNIVEGGVGTIGLHPAPRMTGVARYREDIRALPLSMTANFPMGVYLNHLTDTQQLYVPSDFPKGAEHKIAFVIEFFNTDEYEVYFAVPGAKDAESYISVDGAAAAHVETLFMALAETLKKIHAENLAVLQPK